ncbi:hypothetical protein [Chryseobacterium sp. T20]|uniref:hypothetical protein n=1 Tax=Chryseobacterium sp. T20 TaxID=3395375 RepID=UPI0039BD6FD4
MEKCDVSFKIQYQSSETITEASVKYNYPPGSANVETVDIRNAVLQDSNSIKLPGIQEVGTYNLDVELGVNGVVATSNATLNVGGCSSSCETPKVLDVKVLEDGQLVMNYVVFNTSNLAALEYQIAKDPAFKDEDIIYSKVGFSDVNYTQFENIDMRNGNIPDKTPLYIRIRKYCRPNGISEWSDFAKFDSGIWGVEAYCLSGVDDRNKDSLCFGTSPAWKMKVTLSPFRPGIGSLICLTNGMPAIPDNIREFEQNAPENFKKSGIRWIRFLRSDSEFNPGLIYWVDPQSAEIQRIDEEQCY